MLMEFVTEWLWYLLPVFGILGGGSAGTSPFSRDFARSRYGQDTKNTVAGPGKQEQGVLNLLEGLNREQVNAIMDGLNRVRQPQSFQSLGLSPEDQATLDQAYSGAEAAMRRDANLFGQDVMGRSGLTGTSTPVTESILREFLPQSMQLQSQKAQAGLGLGLNMRQLGENARQFNLSSLFQGSQVTPTSGLSLMGNLERTRMARSSQSINGWKLPSPMDNMEQGSRIYSNVGQGTAGFMGKSDARLKRDIRPVSWQWKDGEPGEYLGVIAQQIEQSHPHLVARDRNGDLMVDYGTMVAMLLNEREHLYAQLAQQEQLT
jgi:hypothetical protein